MYNGKAKSTNEDLITNKVNLGEEPIRHPRLRTSKNLTSRRKNETYKAL